MRQPNDEMSRDDRLQRYFDGELPAEENDALHVELSSDEELSAKLEGLRHLSMLVTAGAEAVADDVDTDALFSAIESRIAADIADEDPMFPEAAPPDRPALRVIEGAAASKSRAEEETSAEEEASAEDVAAKDAANAPVVLHPVKAPAEERGNRGLWIVGGTVLAAAAALLFFVLNGEPGATVDSTDETPVVADSTPHGSEVEEVDFGFSTGAIFSVEGQEGERYAVVWISDEKLEEDEEVLQ